MSINRRQFVKSAAALAAAAALPARSWGRILGSNDRLNIGVIGTGGQGTYHVDNFMSLAERENLMVTKVCDVYRRRLNNAISKIKGTADSGTMEYERILDDKSINAVLIATPDHWHTKIAIEAMQAGKDVYVEKPLSLTIEQAIQCREAVKKTKRTLQVGPQGTSEDRWWKAGEAIRAGRIGKPVWSQAGYCRNSREGPFNWRLLRVTATSTGTAGSGTSMGWPRISRGTPTTSSASASTGRTTAASRRISCITAWRRCLSRSRARMASIRPASWPQAGSTSKRMDAIFPTRSC